MKSLDLTTAPWAWISALPRREIIVDAQKIEQGVRLILEGVGEDPDREGLRETPARVARMYEEVFAGLT